MKLFKAILCNGKHILRYTIKIAGVLFSGVTILLAFFSWSDFGMDSKSTRICVLLLLVVLAVILAVAFTLLFRWRTIWKRGTASIQVRYADLISIAFPKCQKLDRQNKIVVIPVNTCFDTIVDADISKVDKPLVSPTSIHGKWIASMQQNGVSVSQIDAQISTFLTMKRINPHRQIPQIQKIRGNLNEYPEGTIAVVRGKRKTTFFLLAVAGFDTNNVAHCTREQLIHCIEKLISYYNDNGQGFDFYIPLIGTGLSKTDITHQESMEIITTLLKLHSDKIHGRVSVVVFGGDKDKVSILDCN